MMSSFGRTSGLYIETSARSADEDRNHHADAAGSARYFLLTSTDV
jgi:hypothetical protein